MIRRLTDEELSSIRERAEKATEGNWSYFNGRMYSDSCVKASSDLISDTIVKVNREADGEFISHAREDIPKLLAEIERLRREITFITNVDLTKNAVNEEHIAVSVKSWALDVLGGVNHDD